jgi:hypothetical protein
MPKKGKQTRSRAKEPAKRIKAKRSVKRPGNPPSIPDLTDALSAAMARLKTAQISRLLGDAIPAGLPGHAEAGQDAVPRKKAGKARKEAGRGGKQTGKPKKRAMKKTRQANPAGEAGPQHHNSGTRLRKAA